MTAHDHGTASEANWEIEIRNIAGIRAGRATLEPGVNVVRGTNSRGKSSFLSAIATALGVGGRVTEGEDDGAVTLRTGDRTATVELVRDGDDVVIEGQPYATDPETVANAECFAVLTGTNPLRRAVREGRNLEAAITRPLDRSGIEAEISALSATRADLDDRIDDLTAALDRLPTVEERIDDLDDELSSITRELEAIESSETVPDDRRSKLAERRADRDRVGRRIDRLERSVDRIRADLDERRKEREALTVPEASVLDERVSEARERASTADRETELVRSVYAATRRLLDEDRLDLLTDVDHGVLGDEVTCWCCGGRTDRGAIEEQLSALGERVTERRRTADRRRERVEALERERAELSERRQRRDALDGAIVELETALVDRRDALADARSHRKRIENDIVSLSETVAAEDDRFAELEARRRRLAETLEDAREERASLRDRRAERASLLDERDRLTDEIETLRERRDRRRRRTREAFGEAIESLVADLELGFEAARLTPAFDLVVARDGRRADLGALAEGERELLSVVAGLAGNEAFDVADSVPVVLLDEVSELSADTLATLADHVSSRVPFVVLTAFPEDDAIEGNEIDPREWTVVSRDG